MLGGGLGEFALGGFPAADSLSVGDPLSGLLTDPHAKREFLLRALPLDSIGIGNPVDLSGGGYVSRSTDTPFKHFQPAIARPGDFTVSLPVPALHGGTQAGIGAAVLNNPDERLDAFAEMDWLGVDVDVLLGPKEGALTEFTTILSGPGAGVSRSLDDMTVMFRDAKFGLQKPIQPHKYSGHGAAIRLNGSTGHASGTVSCPAGSMTLEVYARPTAIPGAAALAANWRGTAAGAGTRMLSLETSGRWIWYVTNDAGTLFSIGDPASAVSVVGTRIHVAGVIDLVAMKGRLYIDGELIAEQTITGTYNTVLTAFSLGKAANLSSNWFPGDVDDPRVWSVARTQEEIQSTMGAELVGTETGLAYYNKLNEGAGTTAVPTTGSGTLTLTGGATWVGSLEGDDSIAGKPKPLAFGVRRQVSPVWVDTQNNVYQFHDGPMEEVTALRDSGDPVTFGSDVADIYASVPSAGTYNTSLATGLVRLGSAPVGIITGDIKGDEAGVHGYQFTTTGIARKILVQYGGLDNDTEFDNAAFAALLAANARTNGLYIDSEMNVDAAVNEVFSSIWAWWGPNRVGVITCGRIADPATLTPTVALVNSDLKEPTAGGQFHIDPVAVRVGEVRVLYRPYHTVLSDDQVAGAVALATRKDYGTAYRVARAVDADRTADADVLELVTNLDTKAGAEELARFVLDVLKVDRRLIRLTLEGGLLSYFIGTVMSLSLVSSEWLTGRYGLSGSAHFILTRLSEFYGDSHSADRVEIALFG